jgi:hypothetical protein
VALLPGGLPILVAKAAAVALGRLQREQETAAGAATQGSASLRSGWTAVLAAPAAAVPGAGCTHATDGHAASRSPCGCGALLPILLQGAAHRGLAELGLEAAARRAFAGQGRSAVSVEPAAVVLAAGDCGCGSGSVAGPWSESHVGSPASGAMGVAPPTIADLQPCFEVPAASGSPSARCCLLTSDAAAAARIRESPIHVTLLSLHAEPALLTSGRASAASPPQRSRAGEDGDTGPALTIAGSAGLRGSLVLQVAYDTAAVPDALARSFLHELTGLLASAPSLHDIRPLPFSS